VTANSSITSGASASSYPTLNGQLQLWVNTKTMGAVTWDLTFGVDSFAQVDDLLMASGSYDVLIFNANDDNGTPIGVSIVDDWRTRTGKEQCFSSAYVSARGGPMMIGCETDENGAFTYETNLVNGSVNFVNHRAVFGRGLVGEYARLSFMDVDGADFEVAAVALYAWDRARRIGS